MTLSHLALVNFRSYERLDLDFEDGLTLIVGDNAAGKTNLAESIHYLSLARSWRSKDDANLIREGSEGARIEAVIQEGLSTRRIEVELGKAVKRILLNGKPVRKLSELSKVINVIVFSPKDVPLFMGSPGERRGFLDVSLSKQSNDYFSLASNYSRLLKERNAALKSYRPDASLVEVLTQQLIAVAEPMVKYRAMFVSSLNAVLPDLLTRLRGEKTSCEVLYKPFVRADGKFSERAKKAFAEALESDLAHKSTSLGPHREDISFRLNGKDVADYGSQGENRMVVLALKLAPYLLIDDPEKKPICVLDDVTSELDEIHVANLIEVLKSLGQVFITATKLEISGASYIDVSSHNAIRRKR